MRILITGGSGFIGTHAVKHFMEENHEVLNYSLDGPLDPSQISVWRQGDILDRNGLMKAFADFAPHWVLHLAARAECDERQTVEEGFKANTEGTQNVLDAIKATDSVARVIVTSSQFVCAPGRLPNNAEDYFPETTYGASKVITEQLTREAKLQCCWTIIRPTNIWGPFHLRYRREFWRVLLRKLYLHPGRQPTIRCYGYVRNIVHQISRIFELPTEAVNAETFYLGDEPADIFLWVNGFSRALTGRDVKIIPRPMLKALARMGDVVTHLTGRPFLINSSRYRSMITEYRTPMAKTFAVLGPNPFTLEDGIQETVQWLGAYRGPDGRSGGS